MAFVLWQTGQPGAAIATLELAIKNGVKQRDIHVKLGTYLAETGAASRAIALLETLPKDDTEALNALGIAYGHAGRAADAMRVFKLALELDATNGLAYQNIGTLQLRAGDMAAAEASLDKRWRPTRPWRALTPDSASCWPRPAARRLPSTPGSARSISSRPNSTRSIT